MPLFDEAEIENQWDVTKDLLKVKVFRNTTCTISDSPYTFLLGEDFDCLYEEGEAGFFNCSVIENAHGQFSAHFLVKLKVCVQPPYSCL